MGYCQYKNMEKNKDTLPSLRAVQPDPALDSMEMILAIELRKWLKGGFTKARIARVLSLVRDDNL